MDHISSLNMVSRLNKLIIDDFLHHHRGLLRVVLDSSSHLNRADFLWGFGLLLSHRIEFRNRCGLYAKVSVICWEKHILQTRFRSIGLVARDINKDLRAFRSRQLSGFICCILAMILSNIVQPPLLDLAALAYLLSRQPV